MEGGKAAENSVIKVEEELGLALDFYFPLVC